MLWIANVIYGSRNVFIKWIVIEAIKRNLSTLAFLVVALIIAKIAVS